MARARRIRHRFGPVTQGVFHLIYLYSKARAIWATRDQGASAVEYGLLVAAIAAIIVAIVFTLGTKIQAAFSDTCTAIGTGDGSGTTGCAP
jgi:pilus assembly protein Flp/PilA